MKRFPSAVPSMLAFLRGHFCAIGLVLAVVPAGRCAVWQYSVPAPSIEGRRAFLWRPPAAPRVRGLAVTVHNMLEEPLFERPAFREACAENGLGILMIFPGHNRAPDDERIGFVTGYGPSWGVIFEAGYLMAQQTVEKRDRLQLLTLDESDPANRRRQLDVFVIPNFPKGEEDPKDVGRDLQRVLESLAAESGHAELSHAPLLPVGYSSAGSFVWHIAR